MTIFSRDWQFSLACIPGPETMLTPAMAARRIPIPDSKLLWPSTALESLRPRYPWVGTP